MYLFGRLGWDVKNEDGSNSFMWNADADEGRSTSHALHSFMDSFIHASMPHAFIDSILLCHSA